MLHVSEHMYWSAHNARGDFSVCRLTKWGHKYMNNISRTALRVASWAFYRFIWLLFVSGSSCIPSSHNQRQLKVFTATRQNKSSVKLEDIAPEIYLCLVVSRMYLILLILLLLLLLLLLKKIIKHYFLRNKSQYFFHVFILIVNPLYLPKKYLFNFH